jgi:dolichol-phosphate mannosyltransferase
MTTDTVICLPTLNEAANLNRMTVEIHRILPESTILIIDDGSTDGTAGIADDLANANSQIQVVHRKGTRGLGHAYRMGFKSALSLFFPKYVVQMDADFSHLPEKLPELISAASNADLVIGSRYTNGGAIENWAIHRRWLSRFGSTYARMLTGIPVQDLTGGFKVWRSDLLRHVLAHTSGSGGYVFQIETTLIAYQLRAKIVEVPIMFRERENGSSKMSTGIALEAGWRVPLLAYQLKKIRRENE